MEVVKNKCAILSNYEVYSLLQGITKQDKKKNKKQTHFHLANIAFDTVKYLEKSPCRHQSAEIIQNFLSALSQRDFKLTKSEKLQLVNLRPTTPVEMQLVVEDSEERLSEEQIEELIALVEQYLPGDLNSSLPNGT